MIRRIGFDRRRLRLIRVGHPVLHWTLERMLPSLQKAVQGALYCDRYDSARKCHRN
jgi:hypothetical protein